METIRLKFLGFLQKYKYVLIIVSAGILLMMIPGKSNSKASPDSNHALQTQVNDTVCDNLEGILKNIDGAGKVQVMLTVEKGEQTYYQSNIDHSESETSVNVKEDTIIIADNDNDEHGLVNRIDPPRYLGAIILAQGADKPSVRLAIIDAVSKATGLGADRICVLKMK